MLYLPQLPADDSTATTAAQIQQLVTLCEVPVVPAKHHIRGNNKDLTRLLSPAINGRHFGQL